VATPRGSRGQTVQAEVGRVGVGKIAAAGIGAARPGLMLDGSA